MSSTSITRTSLEALAKKAAKGEIAPTRAAQEAAPSLPAGFWDDAEVIVPARPKKALVSLRLDQDVLDWFKHTGPGYQSRMNAVLRSYMERRPRD